MKASLPTVPLSSLNSALADESSGKKKIVVPYRESVLTKLLMPALGGNSRTIMVSGWAITSSIHIEGTKSDSFLL